MRHERIEMTAQQLRIHPSEHAGLRQLADDLEAGRIRHHSYAPNGFEPEREDHEADAVAFNMAHGCGSACCIMGWLYDRGQLRRGPGYYCDPREPLHALFYPIDLSPLGEWLKVCDAITAPQGAAAIRNFLTSGEPRWGEVLGASS